jgi:hypothetical protein
VAGQVVEAGQVLELRFVLLAVGDQAHDAEHAHRRAGGRNLHRAAVVNPVEFAGLTAHPVLAVVVPQTGEMLFQGQEALGQVFRIDAAVERVAGGRQAFLAGSEQAAGGAGPAELVGRQIPVIEHVAGGFDRRLKTCQLGRHLIVCRRPLHGLVLLPEAVDPLPDGARRWATVSRLPDLEYKRRGLMKNEINFRFHEYM